MQGIARENRVFVNNFGDLLKREAKKQRSCALSKV